METARRRLGDLGEDQACSHLERLGHVVLERNWRHSHLEIDIISRDPEGLHFVEVKTRSSNEHFDPMRAVNDAKKRHMVAAANAYLNYYQLQCEVQYDVIILVGEPGFFKIEYYPDFFMPKLKTYR